MSFSGKVVLVTGASSGIGAATAIQFAAEGASVALVGRNAAKLAEVSKKLKNSKSITIQADVTTDAKKIIGETITKLGKLDILVNNAGLGRYGSLTDGTYMEAYDTVMSVNVRAVAELTMLAMPHLAKTKGNIVNISSVAAASTPMDPGFLSYCVSKAALDHFTKGSAKEFAPMGIRVNGINPGPVQTDFFDNVGIEGNISIADVGNRTAMKRVSSPFEIADLIMYLAGDKAKGITGSLFFSDNGYMLV